MLMTALLAVVFVGVLGLIAMLALRLMNTSGLTSNSSDLRITWSEYGISMVAVVALVIPLVLWIGSKMSVNEKLTYQEFYNGVETAALTHVTHCYAGHSGDDGNAGKSNCTDTYVSGTYDWEWTYTTTSCTGSGTNRTCTSTTHHVWETSNIYTPYATEENTYSVEDSLGGHYNYPYVYLDAHPVPYGNHSIPGNLRRGAPADWLDAKRHLDEHDPRPVTRIFSYDNYILASDEQSAIQYSSHINQYLKAGLLPDHTANILTEPMYGTTGTQAKKVSFVGVKVSDPAAWQKDLMQFNAALGMKLQGDLHVVLINNQKVSDAESEQYINALKAYWQSSHFGKKAISKNGVILVLGVSNNSRIDWVQATTGMPRGNGTMLLDMASELKGQPLNPTLIFGHPRTVYDHPNADVSTDRATVTLSTPRGILEHVMFEEDPFARVCMKSCPAGTVGYSDLIAQIQPSQGQKNWMIAIVCLISLAFWAFVGLTSFLEFGSKATARLARPVRLQKRSTNTWPL